MNFEVDHVVKKLSEVQPDLRCVFAALCAERLLPWFDLVTKEMSLPDPISVSEGLRLTWDYAEQGHRDDIAVAAVLKRCETQIDSNWEHRWANAANDCVASVAYGLLAVRSNEAADAAWAGMRISDAVFQYIVANVVLKGETGVFRITKADKDKAVDHPLHEAEIGRQEEDLADLVKIRTDSLRPHLTTLRERARAAVPSVFGIAPA